MKVDKEQRRLKSIKLKYVFFTTKCHYCGQLYKREKMWQLYRYGINATWQKWHYCQNCMHSAEEVLNEVDTDEFPSGIAGIDNFFTFSKKDYTRMNIVYEESARRLAQREKAFSRIAQ